MTNIYKSKNPTLNSFSHGGVGVAIVIEVMVHHVGIAPVGVRVPAAGMKKDIGWTPAQFCAPIVQRIYKQLWKISLYILRSE